ncbi:MULTISPECIES: hypothetical protein [Rhodococcus]|uniref:Lipoprotein n=1 Tax=Rhodococcus cerastii TaxID=908616 RepID=A0ABU4D560_9NOCA|nr:MULTISPECIES: hypothetical protein [Rhodococcus]MDV6304427.1 hypothetical protein [Rhodococcus cerastii]MDV7991237.1 hypothetical protein [Rhodococcus sp. IEGM 1374]MDV8077544.1 hypothetical protein [Rhodococcus sp. IEGM 1370]
MRTQAVLLTMLSCALLTASCAEESESSERAADFVRYPTTSEAAAVAPVTPVEDTELNAILACQEQILGKLVAPQSASWGEQRAQREGVDPEITNSVRTGGYTGEYDWVVIGTVDSTNLANTREKTEYVCVTTMSPEGAMIGTVLRDQVLGPV